MPTRSSDRSCSSSISGVNPQNTRWSEACCVSPRREITMRVQTLAGIVSVGAALFGFGEVAMSQTSQLGNVRNVVLVHGGLRGRIRMGRRLQSVEEGRIRGDDRPECDHVAR